MFPSVPPAFQIYAQIGSPFSFPRHPDTQTTTKKDLIESQLVLVANGIHLRNDGLAAISIQSAGGKKFPTFFWYPP